MPGAFIAKVEIIALKNTYVLKKSVKIGQRFAFILLYILFAPGYTRQIIKNAI